MRIRRKEFKLRLGRSSMIVQTEGRKNLDAAELIEDLLDFTSSIGFNNVIATNFGELYVFSYGETITGDFYRSGVEIW